MRKMGKIQKITRKSLRNLESKRVREGLNEKPNSSAVQSMATKGKQITLRIMTEPVSWPCEDSQFFYPSAFL